MFRQSLLQAKMVQIMLDPLFDRVKSVIRKYPGPKEIGKGGPDFEHSAGMGRRRHFAFKKEIAPSGIAIVNGLQK